MRLLNVNTLEFAEFDGDMQEVPPYAITSHRWAKRASDECCFRDMRKKNKENKATQSEGLKKVEGFCKFVRKENATRRSDRGEIKCCDYIWLDTVCINKESSAEVSESINSMFRWYRHAEVCYAYLSDVAAMSDFEDSSWFKRGWTLQELIAPKQVVFLTTEWEVLGTSTPIAPWHVSPDLGDRVAEITGVPRAVFGNRERLRSLSVEEKCRWIGSRKTTKIEDMAYCLLGILDVAMPLIYGERYRAWLRLEKEVSEKHNMKIDLPRPHALGKRDSGVELVTRQKVHRSRERVLTLRAAIPSYYPNELGEELLKAAAEGNESKVRLYLGQGSPCNYRDRIGFTALHHASAQGHHDVADVLIRAGADVNAQSLELGTPLCLSALRGHVCVVRLLLDRNANLHDPGLWTGTPLHCASWCGSEEVARILIECGAKVASINTICPDFLDYGSNLGSLVARNAENAPPKVSEPGHLMFDCQPLIVAAHHCREGLVALFLESGFPIDVEHRLWWTETPEDQSFDDVGEDDRCDNATALMAGSWKGPRVLLSRLLCAGAEVNRQDSWGRSALWIAAQAGQIDCVRLLIEAKADLDAVSNSGKTALHVAADMGHDEVAQYLIEHGADVDRVDCNGRTPCHFATFKGSVPVLETLFKHHARYEARDREGLTPLHSAIKKPWTDLPAIEWLLKHGANPHTRDYQEKTPLHSAAEKGSPAVCLLLDARADAMMMDTQGRTASDYLPSDASKTIRERLALASKRYSQGNAFDTGFVVEGAEKGRSLSDSSILEVGREYIRATRVERLALKNVIQDAANQDGSLELYRPASTGQITGGQT